MFTSGRITHSKLVYTSLKHKPTAVCKQKTESHFRTQHSQQQMQPNSLSLAGVQSHVICLRPTEQCQTVLANYRLFSNAARPVFVEWIWRWRWLFSNASRPVFVSSSTCRLQNIFSNAARPVFVLNSAGRLQNIFSDAARPVFVEWRRRWRWRWRTGHPGEPEVPRLFSSGMNGFPWMRWSGGGRQSLSATAVHSNWSKHQQSHTRFKRTLVLIGQQKTCTFGTNPFFQRNGLTATGNWKMRNENRKILFQSSGSANLFKYKKYKKSVSSFKSSLINQWFILK